MDKKGISLKTAIVIDSIIAVILLICVVYSYENRLLEASAAKVTQSIQQNHHIQPLSLIVVRTQADQQLGLGKRASLPADEGMLFVFSDPAGYGFWMKDMQFPLDIISLNANFSVVHIEPDISPATYPEVFYSPSSTLYVIEANAGYAKNNDLVNGDVLDFAREAVNK